MHRALAVCAVSGALSCASAAAAAHYQLDPHWPASPAWPPAGLDRPTGAAVIPLAGGGVEVHVAQRNATLPWVWAFDGHGALLRTWGNTSDIVSPHGLASSPNGTLWLADISGFAVKEFTRTGELLRTIGTGE
jgi:hypothetical protein